MVVFLITTISCTQAMSILQRITNIVGLTQSQKTEIILEIRKTIPICPVAIKKDER